MIYIIFHTKQNYYIIITLLQVQHASDQFNHKNDMHIIVLALQYILLIFVYYSRIISNNCTCPDQDFRKYSKQHYKKMFTDCACAIHISFKTQFNYDEIEL